VGSKGDDLINKKITLCITGSIAAYRSVDLARELIRLGAEVYVVMSDVIPITWCIVLQSYAASRLMNANRMAAIFMLISTWVGLRVIIMRALITILYGIPFI